MPSQRIQRVNALLRREISIVVYRLMQDVPDVDLASVTISEVDTAPDLRNAHVYVSVRGSEEDVSRTVSRLNGRRKEIQNAVVKNVVLKYTPKLHFRQSQAIASGDKVLAILEQMESDDPEWAESEFVAEEVDGGAMEKEPDHGTRTQE